LDKFHIFLTFCHIKDSFDKVRVTSIQIRAKGVKKAASPRALKKRKKKKQPQKEETCAWNWLQAWRKKNCLQGGGSCKSDISGSGFW